MSDFEKQKIKWDRGELADLLTEYHKHPTCKIHFAIEDFIETSLHQAHLNALEEVEKGLPSLGTIGSPDFEDGEDYILSQIKQILKILKNLKN